MSDDRKTAMIDGLIIHSRTAYPKVAAFRVQNRDYLTDIDELVEERAILQQGEHYRPSLKGVRRYGGKYAQPALANAATLLARLQAHYTAHTTAPATTASLEFAPDDHLWVPGTLTWLLDAGISSGAALDAVTGFVRSVSLTERVLELTSDELVFDPAPVLRAIEPREDPTTQLCRLHITGYRALRDLEVELGPLTVIIGANATGKSSLFQALQLISSTAANELPPGIDGRSLAATAFHVGGPEQITCAMTFDLGLRSTFDYRVEILGPAKSPSVARELLQTETLAATGKPFVFLDFKNGRGRVSEPTDRASSRSEWVLNPVGTALRRGLDPSLHTIGKVHDYLTHWAFYSGFDVGPSAALRQPVPLEADLVLSPSGANLTSVLMGLRSSHPDQWDEIQTHLGSALPDFERLNVMPAPGKGLVMASLKEHSLPQALPLADLSDGTLRFLCWATLLLSPALPSLLCIDEPETGLHPRALAALAGLIRVASSRTQIIVATHSPQLLAEFDLNDIAVMRRPFGTVELVRPSTSHALAAMVSELGREGLIRAHSSGELEGLP